MPDIAVVACAALGTGTGTALMVGAPMYALTVVEERECWRPSTQHPPVHIDAIAAGTLGFAFGAYLFQRSARRLYTRIYG